MYLMYMCDPLFLSQLQKDLEEVKELLTNTTRKRVRDVLVAEKHKLELEIKNQPPPKPKDVAEEEKSSLGGYTVKINNYGRFIFLELQHLFGEMAKWHYWELELLLNIIVKP